MTSGKKAKKIPQHRLNLSVRRDTLPDVSNGLRHLEKRVEQLEDRVKQLEFDAEGFKSEDLERNDL